jgi:hypothetical protein
MLPAAGSMTDSSRHRRPVLSVLALIAAGLAAAGCGESSVGSECEDGGSGDMCDPDRGPTGDGGVEDAGDASTPMACDGFGGDVDDDNWCALHDNCPDTTNVDQSDVDDDGIGDVCDVEECDGRDNDGDALVDEDFADDDEDGVANCTDICPGHPDTDTDFDGLADCADACPLDPLNDTDGDRVCGDVDNCPAVSNFTQSDRDGDSIGDHCDVEECDGISNDIDSLIDEGLPDDDDDGVCDEIDPCLSDPLNDPDLDEVCGLVDNCPGVANVNQTDTDDDGWGDDCDVDAAIHCDAPATLADPGAVPLPTDLAIGGVAAAASSDTIYISLSSSSANYPNSVIAVDAPTASVLWSTFVGTDPQLLALADDGSYLYVDLDVAAQVRVINLPTRQACRSFGLGIDFRSRPLRAGDMEVLPGAPGTIVVSTRRGGVSPDFGGVFVYDHGFARPVSTPDHTGARVIAVANDSTVYGYNNSSTEFGFREMEITAAGITETWNDRDLISGFNADIVYDGGRVYATNGATVDVAGPFLVGTFPENAPVAVEASVAEVFFLGWLSRVSVYDTNTFVWKRDFTLPADVTGQPNQMLLRWGAAGLVAANDHAVVIVDNVFP